MRKTNLKIMTIKKSFQILENEYRIECNKIDGNLFLDNRELMLSTPVTTMTAPSTIEQLIYAKLGRPAWGDIRTTPGWSQFFLYAKVFEERYSIFPYTLFEPKVKNKYYVENIIAMRNAAGAPKVKRSKLESMDSLEIIQLFENTEDMVVPVRRALNMCFPMELVGLSATSSEVEKAINQEIKEGEKIKQTVTGPPEPVNAGKKHTLDELYDIMNDDVQL